MKARLRKPPVTGQTRGAVTRDRLGRLMATALPAVGWTARALGVVARSAVRHRSGLTRLATRACWVLALLLLVGGGTALLDLGAVLDEGNLLRPFKLGLALTAVALVLAAERRLRWAAWALGAAHGALLTLGWTALNA